MLLLKHNSAANHSGRHGWTIDFLKCLDYVAKNDISYTATRSQRNRSEGRLKVFCSEPDHKGGPKNTRPNFTEAVETAMTKCKEEYTKYG